MDNDKEHKVLTLGPISVLPKYQNNGIESELINYTTQIAREMGYKAVLLYGDLNYYKQFGFKE
ncbi:hypothetical protein ALNOE001_08930 [Candidatus Methanobinarius endosymbioticus]|uniref:N-acetyltransferase domain-containing protein n=1 Tax=Candidatus Methanobinarius endosymbioticus TaxID=2006182 RepID=A0A366MCL3_9EURY|nr:hypothetical protein ALNOE001_08930 [Candidatus Methanobinarius endosymbioticus]